MNYLRNRIYEAVITSIPAAAPLIHLINIDLS